MVATTPRSRPTGQLGLAQFFSKKEQKALAKRKKAIAKAKQCVLPAKIKKALEPLKECYINLPAAHDVAYWKLKEECSDKNQKALSKLGVDYLDEGVYRQAFAWNGCVVKIAKSLNGGVESNIKEADAYDLLAPAIKKFFVPITDLDDNYFWVAMPKVDMRSEGERYDSYRELKDELLKRGEYCYDIHSENVGWYNDQLVVLDYGFGCSDDPSSHYSESQREDEPSPPTSASEIHRRAQEEIQRMKKDFEGFQRHFPNLDFANVVKVNSHELIYEAPGHGVQIMNLRPGQAAQEARDSHDARIERQDQEHAKQMHQELRNFMEQFPELAAVGAEKLSWDLHIVNRREAIYQPRGQVPKAYELRDIAAIDLPDAQWGAIIRRLPELQDANRRDVIYIPYTNPHELQWRKPGDNFPNIYLLHSEESINCARMENGLPPV